MFFYRNLWARRSNFWRTSNVLFGLAAAAVICIAVMMATKSDIAETLAVFFTASMWGVVAVMGVAFVCLVAADTMPKTKAGKRLQTIADFFLDENPRG